MSTPSSADVYSAMQSGTPYRTFKKTIVAKVYITYLDPFSRKPAEMIMKGIPSKKEEGCFYHAWSEEEFLYFKRLNKDLLETGNVIEQKPKPHKEEPKKKAELNYNALPDEEIEKIYEKAKKGEVFDYDYTSKSCPICKKAIAKYAKYCVHCGNEI